MGKRQRSLKVKVVMSVSALVFCILTVSLVIALLLAIQIFKEANTLSLQQAALLGKQEVQDWFDEKERWMQEVLQDVGAGSSTDTAGITQRLRQAEEKRHVHFYIGTEQGTLLSSMGWIPGEGYDCREQEWYIQARNNDGVAYLPPYIDPTTGEIVITLSAPVRDRTGRNFGVLSIDIPLERLTREIENDTIMATGRAFLLDSNGAFVVHENPDFIAQDETNIRPYQYFSGSGISTGNNIAEKELHLSKGTNWDGTRAYISLAPISNGWQYGFAVPLSDFKSTYYKLVIGFAVMILVMLALSMVIVSAVTSKLSHPIRAIIDAARDVAVGKVDMNLDIRTGDELEELAVQFNQLADNVAKQIAVMNDMAQGDFSGSTTPRSPHDKLSMTINTVSRNLRELTGQVQVAAEQVTEGVEQMTTTSQALAQSAVEQASAVEQLSISQKKLLEDTRQSAELAREVSGAFVQVRSQTMEGARSMDDMVQAVSEIEKAASDITRVIKAIEDIAFQTNILALNASVEAARAGAQGKGFAVVAEEVRRLAAKSAQAAKETKTLIATAADKAGGGVEIAQKAQAIFSDVAQRIDGTVEMIGTIDGYTDNQVEEITEIFDTVSQMSVVVQRNSSIAEQSAITSQEMSVQAQMLSTLVSGLRTGNKVERQTRRKQKKSVPKLYPSLQVPNKYS